MNPYDDLLNLVAAGKEDYDKSSNGNNAAAKRVRVRMQKVTQLAQEIRLKTQEEVRARRAKPAPTTDVS